MTEDHLDIYGYRPIKMKSKSQEFYFADFTNKPSINSNEAYNYYKQKTADFSAFFKIPQQKDYTSKSKKSQLSRLSFFQ